MTDPTMADHMTRLKLKLLEKKLQNERENLEETDSPLSTARSNEGHEDALQGALRRRKDLLQELREQQFLEELSRPQLLAGSHCKSYRTEPTYVYQPPLPVPPAEPPRIIQHTVPQQPATIIQQLPQQPPLITQIPSPQPLPAPRSGSIKEDMVEMMLMQNAQMHQIIMQNMMLKALPPMAFSQPTGTSAPALPHTQQDPQFAAPIVVRAERPRPSTVHHHHHYSPQAIHSIPAQLPPAGYSVWPPGMPSNLWGQTGGFPPTVHHMTAPASTFPALQTNQWTSPQAAPGFVDPSGP
ncbi:uncharacterized protein C21orf58 homolog [Alligator sinensis]|uniref:Uncharacterized protein C21orf58 homolog n=1 Tax=Alligator sinensis TaxID=38654 RepID=A0A3Q0GEU8_ALLSI|nr:uncharacterized protein C21orf58 homolog [Alligator sinensis]